MQQLPSLSDLFEGMMGGGADPSAGIGGNYGGFVQDPRGLLAAPNAQINENVINWLNQAGAAMPGWHANIAVGPSQHFKNTYTGSGPSQVPMGMAADVELTDPSGNVLPHPLDRKDDWAFPYYQALGDAYIRASQGQGRWGGYYGRPDRIQYGTVAPGYPMGVNTPRHLYATQ